MTEKKERIIFKEWIDCYKSLIVLIWTFWTRFAISSVPNMIEWGCQDSKLLNAEWEIFVVATGNQTIFFDTWWWSIIVIPITPKRIMRHLQSSAIGPYSRPIFNFIPCLTFQRFLLSFCFSSFFLVFLLFENSSPLCLVLPILLLCFDSVWLMFTIISFWPVFFPQWSWLEITFDSLMFRILLR